MTDGPVIARNAFWLSLAQLVTMLVGFFTTAWVARALGPEAYGTLGFIPFYGWPGSDHGVGTRG